METVKPSNAELTRVLERRSMKRQRGYVSYEHQLGLSIVNLATQFAQLTGRFQWYDMCCGQFAAGRGFSDNIDYYHHQLLDQIRSVGVDLDTFGSKSMRIGKCAVLEYGNVVDFPIPEGVQLITCLKGLRYVDQYLGQASDAVSHWYNSLAPSGLLAIEIDCVTGEYGGKPFKEALEAAFGNQININQYTDRVEGETSTVAHIYKPTPRTIPLPPKTNSSK